jgi:pimeloyl-ACP methyl ester carboxylesterase
MGGMRRTSFDQPLPRNLALEPEPGQREARRMVLSFGEGVPIVLVHGNGSTHEIWAATVAALPPGFRAIVYDLPGHGGPPLGEASLQLGSFVADLKRVVAELKLDRFHLVGHSFGAFIAAAFAAEEPDRVPSLALLAMPAQRTSSEQEAGERLIASLRRDGVAKVMSELVASWYTEAFIRDHPQALRERLKQIEALPDEVFIRTYELYVRTEIAPLLPRLGMPTLVLTGELARGAAADAARRAATLLRQPTLRVLDGFKNGLLTEAADMVAAELACHIGIHGLSAQCS